MANWLCVGILKVRGKKEDIMNFIFNGLKVVSSGEESRKIKADDDGWIYFCGNAYIKGVYGSCVKYIDFCLDELEENNGIILLNAEFEWNIDANEMAEISEQYNVDFKIFGFAKEQEFNQDIEIIKGEIIKNSMIYFDDYRWECINPELGGNDG